MDSRWSARRPRSPSALQLVRRAEEPPPSCWAWIRLPLKLGLWPLWAQAWRAQRLGLNGAPSRLSDSSTLDSSVSLQVLGVESGIRTVSRVCRKGLGACRHADSQGALKSAARRGWRSHLPHDWTVERHRVTNQRSQPEPGRLQSPRFRAQAQGPGKEAAVGGRAKGGGFTWMTQPSSWAVLRPRSPGGHHLVRLRPSVSPGLRPRAAHAEH